MEQANAGSPGTAEATDRVTDCGLRQVTLCVQHEVYTWSRLMQALLGLQWLQTG